MFTDFLSSLVLIVFATVALLVLLGLVSAIILSKKAVVIEAQATSVEKSNQKLEIQRPSILKILKKNENEVWVRVTVTGAM